MISLTPISKAIQKRLFEKMKVLGREPSHIIGEAKNGELTFEDLATRSTFIRMTSGLKKPVILMGGELTYGTTDSDGFGIPGTETIAGGYDRIYGPRVIQRPDDYDFFTEDDTNTQNKFNRPMPGIKGIDVSFRGGLRALREATISWTCWSFEDINRLMPHFLSHGKTVMLEWGWVYGSKGLSQLTTFVGPDGIKQSAYDSPKNDIILTFLIFLFFSRGFFCSHPGVS